MSFNYDITHLFLFAGMFTITKFSGAGVPGGTILIMSPVLEKVFGFTPEMIGLITTIYILVDPITTSGSVLGNNAFVIIFQKLISCFSKTQTKPALCENEVDPQQDTAYIASNQ